MAFLKSKQLGVALRLVLGVVFLYASLDKVQNPQQFGIAVRAYELIPVSVSNLFAIAVSWTEALAGLLLIIGVFTRPAGAAVFLLLGMFIVAIATVLVRGMVIDCGCFKSEGGSSIGPLLLVRNVFLLAAAFIVIRYDQGFLGLSSLLRPKPARG